MAISSAGIGSGLDVANLVSQLVATERAAPDARINRAQSKAQTTLSALGTFRSALAGLQDAAKTLRDGGATKLSATSSNTGLLTTTTTTATAVGSYSVEVLQLAKTHKLASAPHASSSSIVGLGKLTLSTGGASFTLDIGATNNTLAGIRDAINGASSNPGIKATLLNTTAGVRLTLTAPTTGQDAAITVSASTVLGTPIIPAGTGLDALSYTPGNLRLEQIDPAQNAKIKIDGFEFQSQSNEFANAVDGLRFTAHKAEPGTVITAAAGLDSKGAETAAQNFVTRYNALNAVIASFSRYDPVTQIGGPLLGDATVRGFAQQVRAVMGSLVGTGSLQSLSQVGITGSTDGSFKLDASKFAATLNANPDAVNTLFGSTGIGGSLVTLANNYLEADGRIASKTDHLNAQLKGFTQQQASLDRRMDMVEARYRAQFSALDTLISQLSNTSSYLSQQLQNLPGAMNRNRS